VSWERKREQENSGAFMRLLKQRVEGRHSQKGQDIVELYYYIKFRGIAVFHTIAFISVTSTNELNLLTAINHGQY